ncbi:MAG: hypothetical protein ACK5GN_06235 [Pseudomonadota bacterium]|jgi:hypothetical protein
MPFFANNPKNVFEAILKYGHDEDFNPKPSPTFVATDAPAGSLEKIEILRQRVELGQPLWHDGDRVDYSGIDPIRFFGEGPTGADDEQSNSLEGDYPSDEELLNSNQEPQPPGTLSEDSADDHFESYLKARESHSRGNEGNGALTTQTPPPRVKLGEWATGFKKEMTDLVLKDPRAAFEMAASCSLSKNPELISGRLESEQEAAKRMFLAAVVGRYSESNFPELLQGSLRLENAADGSKFFRRLVLKALGVICMGIIAQSKKEIAKNPTSRETVCNAARHEIVGLVKGVSAWSKKSSSVALLESRLIKGLSQRDAAEKLGFKRKKAIELESRLKKKLFGENHYGLKIFPSSRPPYNNPAGYDREPKAAGKVTAGNNLSDKEFIERYSDWLGPWAKKICVERSKLFRELMSGINRDPDGIFDYGPSLDASSSPTTNEFASQDQAGYFTRIFYVAFAGRYGRFPQGGNLYPIPLRMVGHQIGCDYFRSVAITAARAQISRLLVKYPNATVVPNDLKQEIAQVLSKDFFVFWYGYPERIDLVKSRILTGTSLKEFAESRHIPVDKVSKWEQYFKKDFDVLRGRDGLFPLPSRRGSLEGAL